MQQRQIDIAAKCHIAANFVKIRMVRYGTLVIKRYCMAYEKRVCVLRQIRKGFSADGSALTGAVYAERLGTELTVTPRIAALSPLREGRYALYLWADDQTFCLELKGNSPIRLENAPSIAAGFAALLCFVKGEPSPIAYGRCGAAPANYAPLLAEPEVRKRPVPIPRPPVEIPMPNAPNVPLAPTVPVPGPLPDDGSHGSPHDGRAAARDNDEAIAADNYFPDAAHGDEKASASAEGETGAAAVGDAHDLFLRPRGALTYYYSVKDRLDAAFSAGERDTRLCAVYPQSEWVRQGDALLGIIYAEGIPRWLCVAAEGEKPTAMGEHAIFVPASPYTDSGFWVVFQDADTGEYVSVSEQ